MKLRLILLTAVIVAVAFSLLGIATPTQAQAAGNAFIRVVHASPGAPAVDVYLDSNPQPAITNLAFGKATDFMQLPAKRYTVTLRPAGTPASDTPILQASITIARNASATVVAQGILQGQGDQGLKLGVYITDRSPTNGKARVQVIHTSPDAPAVDVLAGTTPVIKGLKFGLGTRAVNLDPGTYDLTVVASGTTTPVVLNLPGTNLAANTIYTVIAFNNLSNIQTLVLTTSAPPPANGFVRIVHASPDAPAVDIYLDRASTPAITNLAFGQATDFMQLTAKRYTVSIRPTGAPATDKPIFETTVNVPANVSATVVALGELAGRGTKAFKLSTFVTDRSATNGKARVQVIHASPDSLPVDVRSGDNVVVKGLGFARASATLNLDPGNYNLAVVPSGAAAPVVINLANTALNADTIYTVIAINTQDKIQSLVLVTATK